MIEPIGKVELIINEKFLLISSEVELFEGDIVVVFTKVEHEEIREKFHLPYIGIPKGSVTVTSREDEKLYLAELFQYPKETKKVLTVPTSFEKLKAGPFSALLEPKIESIYDSAPGEWSGVLDKRTSLKMKIKMEITVGDLVGRS